MRKLNRSAVQYITYQTLLESNLTASQRDRLLEAGIVDKVMSWLGGGADTAKQLGGAAMQLFKQNKFSRRMVAAEKNIQKEIDELKTIAKDAGQPEEAVLAILKSILDKAGAPVDEINAAAQNPPADGDKGGGKGGEGGGAKPGTPLKTDSPEAVPNLVSAAADAAGQDPEQARNTAEEKKVTPEKATEILAKSVAKLASVEPKAASAVIKALIDGGHLVAESRRRLNIFDIRKAINESNEQILSNNVLNRWSHLSGIASMKESVAVVNSRLWKQILLSEAPLAKELKDAAEKFKEVMPGEANYKKQNQQGLDTIIAKIEKGEEVKENEFAGLANLAKDDESKKFVEQLKKAASSKEGGDKEGDKKAEEAKKKFGGAFEVVKKAVGDAVNDESIGKILDALDGLDAIQIK